MMSDYISILDNLPPDQRWAQAKKWIVDAPHDFFRQLRRQRPVYKFPELTMVTLFNDCREVMLRHDLYSVGLYAPKQGSYFMAQDDTAQHWREKSIMRTVLNFEEIPGIRNFVETRCKDILKRANGQIDAVNALTRAVPIALVQDWFGFVDSDPGDLCAWSYWSQMDAFWNQSFDDNPRSAQIIANHASSTEALAKYVVSLVQKRSAELKSGAQINDTVSRLIKLAASGGFEHFPAERLVINIGGLLIGAVETTSHAVCNAIRFLSTKPELLDQARKAARDEDLTLFDGYIFEALRFAPAFPYFFRLVTQPVVIGLGEHHETPLEKGDVVLVVSASGMFDEAAYQNPEAFDPRRSMSNNFVFGLGLHECLGRAIGAVMIPEIARQALLLDDLELSEIDYLDGPVPEKWQWRWRAC